MYFSGFAKRIFAIWMALFFLSTPILGARVAYAQATLLDIPRTLEWIKNGIKDFISNTLYVSVVTTLVNTVSFTADRLAYDAAVRIATGGPAEDPLFNGTPNQTYLGLLAMDIAGEAIGSLSEEITGSGGLLSNFNLCAPSSPYILLQLKLGIKGVYERPEPKCDFNKMFGPEGDWTSFIADLEGYDEPFKNQLILAELANMYDPQQAEFGAGLQVSTDIFGKATFLPFIGVQENISSSGFKPAIDVLTGQVQTPAQYINDFYSKTQSDTAEERKWLMRSLVANGKILQTLGTHAASVFTNTLVSKYQERIWTGLFDFDTNQVDPFDPESFALSTSEDTAQRYRTLLTAAPLQITNYSILSDFVTCPGADMRGLYNCVADSNFISAVAREEAGAPVTIAEAIDDGLLDGSWPLIPAADVARNQDAFCYTYGFCSANLAKLRKARVISLGWELAANSSANSVESPVTLQEVLDGFHACGSEGLPDEGHPWCKLIDPDWVLKYPDTQCRMQTYGELLLTDQADERAQTCVDMPSCIADDESGNCVGGYGYCVAEENTWRFRGESCPEYAASCLALEDSEGEAIALLKNTVDPGPCTEDTVGCRWYATQKEEQEDGTYAFAAIESIAEADASSETYASRIYVNNQAEDCSAEDGGCATLIERDTDLRLNTIINPSFENDADTNGRPDGWYEYHFAGSSWPSEVSSDGSYAYEGEVAMSPGEASSGLGALYQPGIELGQARTYTLSFYARQLADGDVKTIDAILDLRDEAGTSIDVSGLAITGDCDDSYANIFGTTVSTGIGIEDVQPEGVDFERFSCTFTVPPLSDRSLRIFGDLYFKNFDGYVDSVQLEQGEDASASGTGYSDTNYSTIVAKVAPAYLGCTGSTDDPEECENYAQVCAEQDMGCTLYTPVNGDPAVSGIATELDTCPAECAGYDTYRQEATRYEPNGVDAVYFIPDTANSCQAEQVGCDEFTNIATEEREYYSFLRACVTETQAATNISSDNAATYYTWEGSDEDGYQLRTWTLLESNAGSSDYTQTGTDGVTDTAPDQAPCSNWTATSDGIVCADTVDANGDGFFDWDTEECNARADIFTNANCREFYDENGNIHYRDWENTVTVNNACQSYRKTTIAGDSAAEQETTCTGSGGYYVADSGECRYYGYSEESTSCDESANGCRAYAGGRSRNSRLVLEELFEEGTLNQWDAASAADATYSNESLAADGHSMLLTGPVTSFIGGDGSECTDTEGCTVSARSFGGECTIGEGGTYCGTLENELYAGKTYTVSVVAKGTGTLQLGFDFNADPADPAIDVAFNDAIELEDGWQILTVGPLIMDAETYPLFGEGTTLVLVPTGTAYVDNIVLREGEENITVLRDSWVTPASCDASVTGEYSPQYYLGCQEYATQDGETAYLKSLSSLCSEDKVGCDAFFKTQESESVAAKTYHATCNNVDANPADGEPDVATTATACYYFYESSTAFDTTSPYLCTIAAGESSCLFSQDGFTPSWQQSTSVAVSYGLETVVTPADQDMFLVVTNEKRCDTSGAGCTEVGTPKWSQDRNSTTGADSTYLMNLPDTYDTMLCAHDELFCDAFTASDASTYYFKHPLNQVCEYRTDVTVNGVVYSGWFREGGDEFCYGTCEDASGNEGAACGSAAECGSGETCNAENPSYVIGGTESGIWKNGDDAYANWAGTCSAAYDTCTEFQDKLAQDDGEVYGTTNGTSYFYLNNDTLSDYGLSDSQKCDGQVSLKNGCAMFYDTGETSITANASATEMASRHADVLFGAEPYGLVDPIDCENGGDTTITTASGEEIDLCATRCIYDRGEINDLSDGTTYEEKIDVERESTTDYSRDEIYVFGGSCYNATDCPSVQSESGANIEAILCGTQARVDPFSLSSSFGGSFSSWTSPTLNAGFEEIPRQENDTNTVLKVNRDRSCAEWLACSTTNTQWDEASSSFVTTCGDIALCKGYDPATGTSSCADWDFEKPDVLFDAAWYTSRDTSWYGNEYSGMAIPNLFPVQSLTQADVSPVGYCDAREGQVIVCPEGTEVGEDCTGAANGLCLSVDDAVAAGIIPTKDYALVLNAGACSEEGQTCSVGYCEENGAACATSDQCSSGDCVVGSCYTVGLSYCQTAADCNEGQTCFGGACADIGSSVAIEDYNAETETADSCTSDETFVPDAEAMKLGSCVNGQCLLTPDGETYADGTTEGKICRAYPENNSPFSNAVVDQWYEPAHPGFALDASDDALAADALPYGTLSGFDNVVTCAYGEDCDCSYTKVTFGDGLDTRYYGKDWNANVSVCAGNLEGEDPESDAGDVCTSDDECESTSCVSAQDQLGICQSGPRTGGYCTADEQCGENDVCQKTTREDVIYGLNGFCLEKDTSLNILGDRNKQACISWLPVDQLAGDTDLNAKYTGAGYFADTYACADVKAAVDLSASDMGTARGGMACAETSIGDCTQDNSFEDLDVCMENAVCPEGFFAIVGQCAINNSYTANYANACIDAAGADDCPYTCIPKGSYRTTDETACDTSGIDWSFTGTSTAGTEVYAIGADDAATGYTLFDETVNTFSSCTARGVDFDDASDAIINTFQESSQAGGSDASWGCDSADSGSNGYRCVLFPNLSPYPMCEDVVQVVDGTNMVGYAWTDRVRMNSWTLDSTATSTRYSAAIGKAPYGAISENPAVREAKNGPQAIAACAYDDAGAGEADTLYPPNGETLSSCDDPYFMYGVTQTQPENAEARAYVDYAFTVGSAYWNDALDWGSALQANGSYTDAFTLITEAYASLNIGQGNEVFGWNGTWTDELGATFGYTDNYDATELSALSSNLDVRPAEGNPPKIWAVDTQSCSDDGIECEEGTEGRFTLNGEETGDQSGSQYFNATVKFYAAADKNQLPIRRVIVDWGDDIGGGSFAGSEADDNFFKNARGLEDGTQNAKCDAGTEWGMTPESCDPYYFSYSHIYTCSSEILRDSARSCAATEGTSDAYPCWEDQTGDGVADSCVFQPRVHIRDNWGFCTGTCTTGTDGRTDCFDGDNSILSVGRESEDECNYESVNPLMDSFIDYNGVITVTP